MFRSSMCLLGYVLLSACASSVQPIDGGTQDVAGDVVAGDDVAVLDAGMPQIDVPEENTRPDVGMPLDSSVDVMPYVDASTDVMDSGFYTGSPLDLQGATCNNLFPSIPLRTIRFPDQDIPQNQMGGVIQDGLYRLIRYEIYRLEPGKSPRSTLAGFTLRIRGGQWEIARVSTPRDALDGTTIYRYNCNRSVRSDRIEPNCVISCPGGSRGVTPFGRYEVQGNLLMLASNPEIMILERVGDP